MNTPKSETSSFSLEKSLLHSSDLLRYLAAIAYETGESLSGSQRDLLFSMLYLIERLKCEVDGSLAHVERC